MFKIKILKPIHIVVAAIIATVVMYAIYSNKNVSLEVPNYLILKVTD